MNDFVTSLMKLGAQLAFLYVVLYIVASGLGDQSSVVPGAATGQPRNMNRKGGTNAWRGRYSQFGAARWRYQPSAAGAPDADSSQSPAGAYTL